MKKKKQVKWKKKKKKCLVYGLDWIVLTQYIWNKGYDAGCKLKWVYRMATWASQTMWIPTTTKAQRQQEQRAHVDNALVNGYSHLEFRCNNDDIVRQVDAYLYIYVCVSKQFSMYTRKKINRYHLFTDWMSPYLRVPDWNVI